MNNYLSELTVIIVTYKTNFEILRNCLQSIDRQVKTIIVENSSELKYEQEILNQFSNVEVMCTTINLGMGRGNNFGLSKVKKGIEDCIYLGNLDAKRDWGHAKDYVEMQWRILQQNKPEDFVVATGHTYSVKQFINTSANFLNFKIVWAGKGTKERAYLLKGKKKELIIKVDKKYFRPNEVHYLRGNASKALRSLNFKPKYSFLELIFTLGTGKYFSILSTTAIGPAPGPPPPCGVEKVLCKLICTISKPIVFG